MSVKSSGIHANSALTAPLGFFPHVTSGGPIVPLGFTTVSGGDVQQDRHVVDT